jgi:hypothetical protein
VALVEVGDARAVLKEGEWSDWMDVRFDPLPGGVMALTGMVRFYAKQLRPGFQVYASPVNISPAARRRRSRRRRSSRPSSRASSAPSTRRACQRTPTR